MGEAPGSGICNDNEYPAVAPETERSLSIKHDCPSSKSKQHYKSHRPIDLQGGPTHDDFWIN